MRVRDKDIESEMTSVVGRFEWATEHGVGVSFSSTTTDEALARVPRTIACAVWISLANAAVTDSGLARLEGAAALEHVNLAGTRVTPVGIERLLATTPAIREVEIAAGQFEPVDLKRIRKISRNVRVSETP